MGAQCRPNPPWRADVEHLCGQVGGNPVRLGVVCSSVNEVGAEIREVSQRHRDDVLTGPLELERLIRGEFVPKDLLSGRSIDLVDVSRQEQQEPFEQARVER